MTTQNKNQNTRLPDQVVANLEDLKFKISEFFDIIGYDDYSALLIELVSAVSGPDPRCGKRSHFEIAGAVDQLNLLTEILRSAQIHVEILNNLPPGFHGNNLGLIDIIHMDIEGIRSNLFHCLGSWIYQDVTGNADLAYIASVSQQFLEVLDWLFSANMFNDEAKGGNNA